MKQISDRIYKYFSEMSGLKMTMLLMTFIFIVLYRQFIFFDVPYMIDGDPKNSYVPNYIHFDYMLDGLNFSVWDFKQGLGSSTFGYTNFVFDIFNLLFLIFDKETITTFLIVSLYLKFIAVTYFMYKFLDLVGIENKYVKVIFTLIWAFNGFFIAWGQHYFYATTMVYFTAMVYGLELVLQNKNKILFVATVALTAAFSLYVLGPMAIFVVVYIIVKNILEIENNYVKTIFPILVQVGLLAVLAVLIVTPIALPQAREILSSPRSQGAIRIGSNGAMLTSQIIGRLFSMNFNGSHETYFSVFNYWTLPNLTSSVLVLTLYISSIINSRNKKERVLHVLFVIMLVLMVSTNAIGYLSTLFNKDEQRLFFPIIFGMILISAKHLDSGRYSVNKNIQTVLYIILSLSTYTIFYNVFYATSLYGSAYVVLFSYVLVALVIWLYSTFKTPKTLVFIVMFELIANNYYTAQSYEINKLADYFVYNDTADVLIDTVKSSDDSEFYRMADINDFRPANYGKSLIGDYYGVNNYGSLIPLSYLEFATQMGMKAGENILFMNYVPEQYAKNNLYDFLGVKYLIDVPNNVIEANEDANSFGTVYYNTISENLAVNQSLALKSMLLLDYAIVPEDSQYLTENINIDDYTVNIPVENVDNDQIVITEQLDDGSISYKVKGDAPKLFYKLEPTNLLEIELNISAEKKGEIVIYYGSDEVHFNEKTALKIPYVAGEHQIKTSILADFSITDLRVDCGVNGENIKLNLKLNELVENEALADENASMEISSFENTKIEGNVSTSKDGILVLSMPYGDGWSVYANGEKCETFKVDFGMTGVFLPSGDYELVISYRDVMFEIGCVISILTIIGFTGFMVIRRKNKNK